MIALLRHAAELEAQDFLQHTPDQVLEVPQLATSEPSCKIGVRDGSTCGGIAVGEPRNRCCEESGDTRLAAAPSSLTDEEYFERVAY